MALTNIDLEDFDDYELFDELENRGFVCYSSPNILNKDLFDRLEKLLESKQYHEIDQLFKQIEP